MLHISQLGKNIQKGSRVMFINGLLTYGEVEANTLAKNIQNVPTYYILLSFGKYSYSLT